MAEEVRFNLVVEDNISGPMKEAEDQVNQTKEALQETDRAAERTMLKSVETLTALHALQSGMSAITSSVKTLGLVDDETAESLQKVTAGIQLVVGTAQAVKGVATIFETLNGVLKTTAIVSTFAAIAENPAKAALVVGGAALAAGAVGGYMMSSISNNKTTTVNVAREETGRQAASIIDAGAWY